MATLTVNGDVLSNKAIVAVYIDADGKIIASTTLYGTVDISNNHIGGKFDKLNPGPHLEFDFAVAEVGDPNSVQPRTISILKTCYTKTGQPYPC